MTVNTIDDVLDALDAIVADAVARGDRRAWFAAMYRRVTAGVAQAIRDGRFDDAARMERLDVVFASRYLDAVAERDAAGSVPGFSLPRCWRTAFDALGSHRSIVQHLLLGMNAHINLDLGIATAEVAGDAVGLASLHHDFGVINDVLVDLLDRAQRGVDQVSPAMRLVDWAGGRTDEAIVEWSLVRARDSAWGLATELVAARSRPDGDPGRLTTVADLWTDGVAWVVLHPGVVLSAALSVAGRLEEHDVGAVTSALANA